MSNISVLLIGASGALGAPLLSELQRQKSSFRRLTVLTAPDRANKLDNMDLEVITKSLYDPAVYMGFTDVISAVGNSLMLLQPAMIDAAVTSGVRHFYASEWNSDIDQAEIHNMRYFREKQAVRSFLRQKAGVTPGFQYTLMVTGIFTEWPVDAFYGFDHDNCEAQLFGQLGRRVCVTSIPDIAKYTVDSLRIGFTGSSRTLRVQGWTGRVDRLVAALEEARDCKYKVTYTDSAVARTGQEHARRAGDDLQEMKWSIKPLLASGFGVADGVGELDSHSFEFDPEQPVETFRQVFTAIWQ